MSKFVRRMWSKNLFWGFAMGVWPTILKSAKCGTTVVLVETLCAVTDVNRTFETTDYK